MPRTVRDILQHAEELAARFENAEPGKSHDATTLRQLREAVIARASADEKVQDAVVAARTDGISWAAIGGMLGTSGEAARQRYGQATEVAAGVRR